jgi:hypothetical protein
MKNYENKTYARLDVVSKTCDVCGATESSPTEGENFRFVKHIYDGQIEECMIL